MSQIQIEPKKMPCGGFYIDNSTITMDENGVLHCNGGDTLPKVTVEDAGRVLMVDASGKWSVGSIG